LLHGPHVLVNGVHLTVLVGLFVERLRIPPRYRLVTHVWRLRVCGFRVGATRRVTLTGDGETR